MCKKLVKALPFIVDPIGAVFRVPFSPGGALRNVLDPRREPPKEREPEPVVTGGGGGSVTVRRVQRPPETQQQQSDDDAFQRQRAGAGGSEDVTRGLIKPRTRRSLLA